MKCACAWCDKEGKLEVEDNLILCREHAAEYWDFDEGDLWPDEEGFNYDYDDEHEEGEE